MSRTLTITAQQYVDLYIAQAIEIHSWFDENNIDRPTLNRPNRLTVEPYFLIFENPADAVAFKLRWL